MTHRCSEPDRQMEILESARAGRVLGVELARHADACAACRLAIERLRRMVAVWQRDRGDEVANDREAALGAARLTQRSERRPPARDRGLLSFAALAGVVGATLFLALRGASSPSPRPSPSIASTAVAPSAVADRATSSPGAEAPAPSAPLASSRATAQVEGPRGVIKLAEGLRVDLAAGETARVTLVGGATSELQGPCRVEFWSSSSEVGGWRMSVLPAASSEALVVPDPTEARSPAHRPKPAALHRKAPHPQQGPASAAPNPELDRAWQRTNEALRRDDVDAADRALGDLEKAHDPATRDAARLTRAQLAMAHGQGEAARAALEDLRDNGATPLVRQRAAECLGRLNR